MKKTSIKALLASAEKAEAAGKPKAACEHYTALVSHYLKKHRWDLARPHLGKALRLDPLAPRPYLQRAVIKMSKRDEAGATQDIHAFCRIIIRERSVARHEQIIETKLADYPQLREQCYRAILEIDRTQTKFFLKWAQTLSAQKKWDEARWALLEAFQHQSDSEAVIDALVSFFRVTKDAAALESLGRFQQGKLSMQNLLSLLRPTRHKEDTKKALKEDTGEKDLHTLIAELEQTLGPTRVTSDSVEPLIQEFRRGYEPILAGDSKTRIDLANAFTEMELYQHSESELRKISKNDALYVEAQCALGLVLIQQGRDLMALEVFHNCLRDLRIAETEQNECLYQVILLQLRLGDVETARQVLGELEKQAPDYRHLREIRIEIERKIPPRRVAGIRGK